MRPKYVVTIPQNYLYIIFQHFVSEHSGKVIVACLKGALLDGHVWVSTIAKVFSVPDTNEPSQGVSRGLTAPAPAERSNNA